ncbi:DUF1611 domain-containing protein [Thermodesulfobacteriota bacterium]
MTDFPEGNAIIYCEGGYGTTNGKTAHGLVRRTRRYNVLSVIDSRHAGSDALRILDNRLGCIPIYSNLQEAIQTSKARRAPATHFVMGLAPDGGRLSPKGRKDVIEAIESGLNIDSGLHDFLSEDHEIYLLAEKNNVVIRDIRKCPPREELHFFSGKIEKVNSLKIAVLGTDSAIGKRTTAWILLDALQANGFNTELVGTGQTAWMQGVGFGIILDSIINDFVSGEIEHAVWSAWRKTSPDIILIEGQGSLMNPAYPGGFEILAAGRPDMVILQHAPARKEYDGFPGYKLHPLHKQIQAIELISERPVVAITINHENIMENDIPEICEKITEETGLPAHDVLMNGGAGLVKSLKIFFDNFAMKRMSKVV